MVFGEARGGKGGSELEFGFGHSDFEMPNGVQPFEDASYKAESRY